MKIAVPLSKINQRHKGQMGEYNESCRVGKKILFPLTFYTRLPLV